MVVHGLKYHLYARSFSFCVIKIYFTGWTGLYAGTTSWTALLRNYRLRNFTRLIYKAGRFSFTLLLTSYAVNILNARQFSVIFIIKSRNAWSFSIKVILLQLSIHLSEKVHTPYAKSNSGETSIAVTDYTLIATSTRTITLYKSICLLRKYNTPTTLRQFLNVLKVLLPKGCAPIIVTDAGFRGSWFKTVEAMGWSWSGRVHNCVKYRLHIRLQWRSTK